jgi:hypothetical protein
MKYVTAQLIVLENFYVWIVHVSVHLIISGTMTTAA